MRQQIDCAVLNLAVHHEWFEHTLKCAEHALARIRIHYLDWELIQDQTASVDSIQLPDVQAFAKSAVSLRRYDVCLVPVSLDTLGWTRQALAAIPRGPFLPLVGVFNDLRSAAMQDLLELGLSDFVRLPICPDEFRARILTTVSRVPRIANLREPEGTYGTNDGSQRMLVGGCIAGQVSGLVTSVGGRPLPWGGARASVRSSRGSNARHHGQQTGMGKRHTPEANVSFRSAKSVVVEQFEREYITHALEHHRGNIAMAARASSKHRRAFWALMRKYQIDASLYRPDDDAE